MTKNEMYSHIAAMCADDAEVVEFCAHQQELLARRSSTPHKPTKTQVENEGFKVAIVDILAENDRPMTISEMLEDGRLEGLKNQRVNALVTQLKNANRVVRTEVKGKAYFSLAE